MESLTYKPYTEPTRFFWIEIRWNILIVLVYLGDKIPNYVIANYFYLVKTFPQVDIWLISDNAQVVSRLRSKGVKTWQASKSLVNDSSYRRGFWSQTLNRFFALEEFSREHRGNQILHVEADVILFPNFPLANFNSLLKGIAFPLSNDSVGVASTFWINSYEDINFFCEFLRVERQLNPDLIDTSALGLFSTRYKERVAKLRSGLDSINSYNSAVNGSLLCGDDIPLNSNGIFDASTLGIYLCGTDPRNTFGVSTLFSELSHHRINPKSLEFKIQNSVIFASYGKEMRAIYSLHNHSKDSRMFKSDSAVYLSNRWARANHETVVRYSLNGFLGFCIDYLHLIRSKLFQSLRKAIQ